MKGMTQVVMRPEEVAARHVEIAVIDEPAIDQHKRLLVPLVKRRDPVPGNTRPLVVEDMQVVVEKQQTKERAVFDDRCALVVMIGVTVLRIGAQPGQGRADIDKAEEVEP